MLPQHQKFHIPHSCCPCADRPVDALQKTLDYLTRAYKENDQIYLSGENMAARPFVAAQAKANNMVDGDEYLKVCHT